MANPAQDIEDRVIQYILAGSVPLIDQLDVNLFPRDMPERLDTDPSPSCIVVVGDEQVVNTQDTPSRNNTDRYYSYPVLVLLVKKTSLAPKADSWRKEARFIIKNLLYCDLLLGREGAVKRCVYNPKPDFQPLTFGTSFRVSTQLFTYLTVEQRRA